MTTEQRRLLLMPIVLLAGVEVCVLLAWLFGWL
jgi:hypothetical protein